MSKRKTIQDYATLFDLSEQHSLTLCSTRRTESNGTVLETCWLDESDGNNTLVARFRTWTSRSLSPPYRRQLGWEKFSTSGNLLDREVRYSKRDDMSYLH